MKYLKKHQYSTKKHRHFRSSIVCLALMIVVVISSLLSFFTISFLKFAKTQALDSTRAMTNLLCTTISEMNRSIRNLCVAQFSGSEVQTLLHAQNTDDVTIQQAIARLKRSASSTLNIHSVITYNLKTGQFYSTHRGISDIDSAIKEILQPPYPDQLVPIPRVLDASDYYTSQPVFSYIMYDSYSDEISHALIVNIDASWLFDKLKSIVSKEERLIIFDENFNQLACSDSALHNFRTPVPSYCQQMFPKHSNEIVTIGQEKYFVSISSIDKTNWYLLREIPYDSIMRQSIALEYRLLLFTILIFILGIGGVFPIVHGIYRPIREIATSIKAQGFAANSQVSDDDLSYISQALQTVGKSYHSMQVANSQMMHEALIQAMLSGRNPTLPDMEGAEKAADLLRYELEQCRMAILRLDDSTAYAALSAEQKTDIRAMLRATIAEYIPTRTEGGLINTTAAEFVLFLQPTIPDAQLAPTLRRVQAVIQTQRRIGLSLFYESISYAALPLHTRFVQLQKLAKYRIFDGPSCCLDDSVLFRRETLPLNIPEKLLASLRVSIKRGDKDASISLFSQYHQAAQENNIENYRLCMMRLYSALQSLLDEQSDYFIAAQSINSDNVYTTIMNAEYRIQIDTALQEMIVRMCALENSTEQKHAVLLESVQAYIGLNYADKELSLKKIAAVFHISQAYLGRLFREQYNMSIKEYITHVRLQISANYLKQKSINVKRVMELSGFDNESNFYRLFRARYGTTPTNYRLSHSIEKAREETNT